MALILLLSGLDDLVPLAIFVRGILGHGCGVRTDATETSERRIAIFVPCWRESAVIGSMVRHNLSAIRYRSFDFFLGVYSNDEETVAAAGQLASEFPNVHMALCRDPGPTSKADCLNWVYRRMELFEEERGITFDTIVLHDAEDLIHPQALELINRERSRYEMVQVPVLPLPTGLADVTHGVYCDEFAEFQTIDMRARQISGSFIPSNGVGTGFARSVLARLASERNGNVFDPSSLTEDYEIGVYIHARGYRQCFSPLARTDGDFVATREFFPRSLRSAIRQRTRWITGIALQCWERQGWRGSWGTRYWFWRDRKGLITNPLSVVANALFIAGLLDYVVSQLLKTAWLFEITNHAIAALCATTMILQCCRLSVRAICVGKIFGVTAALTVPLRCFHANLINCTASLCAVRDFFHAQRQNRALAWRKTEHAYPNRELLYSHRRELMDVLIGCGYISEDQMARARQTLDAGSTLDLLLLAKRLVSEEELCRAMSMQSGLAAARVNAGTVKTSLMRNLPAHIEERYGLLPFDVRAGKLLVASAGVPPESAFEEVKELAGLPVDFQLVTQSTYAKMREQLRSTD
ncbi:MAG: glycosyl transferase family protein [Acidobacteriaceae bacterium]|nr:glycosyl transferase family protein [Acidobacteriaceae bacterium]